MHISSSMPYLVFNHASKMSLILCASVFVLQNQKSFKQFSILIRIRRKCVLNALVRRQYFRHVYYLSMRKGIVWSVRPVDFCFVFLFPISLDFVSHINYRLNKKPIACHRYRFIYAAWIREELFDLSWHCIRCTTVN